MTATRLAEVVEILHPNPGTAVIALSGDHDLTTRDAIHELLAALVAENELVVVDVSQVEFIDASFLHNLVDADRESRARGNHFRLRIGASSMVEKVLRISGVLDSLDWRQG